MPVHAGIYKHRASDRSNYGVSHHYDSVFAYGPNEPFDPAVAGKEAARGHCLVRIVAGNLPGLVKAVPIELGGSSRRGMMSGCYLASSNGLFHDLVAQVVGPNNPLVHARVPLHDRFE